MEKDPGDRSSKGPPPPFLSLEGHVAGCCHANSFVIILIYAPVSSRRRRRRHVGRGRLGLHVPAPEISSLAIPPRSPLQCVYATEDKRLQAYVIISPSSIHDGFFRCCSIRVALEHAKRLAWRPSVRSTPCPGDTRLCALIDFPDDPTVTVSRPRFQRFK